MYEVQLINYVVMFVIAFVTPMLTYPLRNVDSLTLFFLSWVSTFVNEVHTIKNPTRLGAILNIAVAVCFSYSILLSYTQDILHVVPLVVFCLVTLLLSVTRRKMIFGSSETLDVRPKWWTGSIQLYE
jgi:hypothetical protein